MDLRFIEKVLQPGSALGCAETAQQDYPEIAEQLFRVILQVHLVGNEIVH